MKLRDLLGLPKKQSANRFDPWASDAAARRAASCVDGYAHVPRFVVWRLVGRMGLRLRSCIARVMDI